jgi:hypothetical protein
LSRAAIPRVTLCRIKQQNQSQNFGSSTMAETLQTIDQLLKHAIERICTISEAPFLLDDSKLDCSKICKVEVTYFSSSLIRMIPENLLCLDTALVQGVLQFSNEDASTILVFGSINWLGIFGLRFLSCTGPVNHSRLISGKLNDKEWPLLSEAIERYRHRSIYFAQGIQSIKGIQNIVKRKFSKTHKVKSIVIDLQCLTEWQQQFHELYLERENYIVQLKNMSRDLDCSLVMIDVAPPNDWPVQCNGEH